MEHQSKILLVAVSVFAVLARASTALSTDSINKNTESSARPTLTKKINALDYTQFWRWPGSKMPANLTINTLYFLQASWARNGQWVNYQHYPTHINAKNCTLVYRLERIADLNLPIDNIPIDIMRWRQLNNNITAVQIDFDSATSALSQYADFLHRVKQKLPPEIKLSVTGLMDWGNAQEYDFRSLAGIVDEIVFQTYQGKSTLPNLKPYLNKILRKNINFKIGLIHNGMINLAELSTIEHSSHFKGYVVFIP